MKRRHSIDEIFRSKLEQHAAEPPMHLWTAIDRRRNWKHKLLNQFRLHRVSLMVVSVAFLALVAWSIRPPAEVMIGSFPIPMPVALPQAERVLPVAPVPDDPASGPAFATRETIPVGAFPSAKQRQLDLTPLSLPVRALSSARPGKHRLPLPPPASVGPQPSLVTVAATPLELPLFAQDPKCAKFNHGGLLFYVDALAALDFPIRQFQPKSKEFGDYADSRRATESTRFSHSAGLRLSARSGFGLALRGGLSYSRINEKFDYFNESEERITITNIYGPGGEIIGTDTLTEVGIRRKVTYNNFQMLDLPVMLGYELEFERMTLTLNGGVYFNLLFRQKGDFLSPGDLQPVSFSSGDPNAIPAYKDKLSMGWFASVGLNYSLNPDLQLVAEPYVKAYPRSFTVDTYILDQRYLTLGLQLGIRQRL